MLSKPKFGSVSAMTDVDPQLKERMELYSRIMVNIDERLYFLLMAEQSENFSIPEKPRFELMQLNMRKVSELTSVACIVASGKLRSMPKIDNEFKAGAILFHLKKIRPSFFPESSLSRSEVMSMFDSGYVQPMTCDDMLKFYDKTHNNLHAGSLKSIDNWYKKEEHPDLDWISYRVFTLRMIVLLRKHRIDFGNGVYLHCGLSLTAGQEKGYSYLSSSPEDFDVGAVLARALSPDLPDAS